MCIQKMPVLVYMSVSVGGKKLQKNRGNDILHLLLRVLCRAWLIPRALDNVLLNSISTCRRARHCVTVLDHTRCCLIGTDSK